MWDLLEYQWQDVPRKFPAVIAVLFDGAFLAT